MNDPTPTPRRAGLQRTTAVLGAGESASGWAPISTALAIDLADLAMIGPTGIVAGFGVGFALTLVLTLATGVPLRRAALLSLLAGIYCMMPFTDVVPLATMLTMLRLALLRRTESSEPLATEAPAPRPPHPQ